MGFFDYSRTEKFPTHFEDRHTAAHTDVLLAGIICSISIVVFSLLITLPAICGWRKKLLLLVKIAIATFIGSVIITSNYGHSWEVGKVNIASPYTAATSEEIHGELGVQIALRGINITLKGQPNNATGDLAGEIIDYNEHFSWEWAQGRFGFGYYAGRISRDFRAAVLRGTPLPILQMAEYFTFDGEDLRFGRYYRWAGWYTHLLMWAAFPSWIIALIFFQSIVNKGATMMVVTGLLQLVAVIIWSTLRNPLELKVLFESEDQKGEVVLQTKYGYDFYLVLVNSILCTVGGVIIFVVNLFYPELLCNFFGIDVQSLFTDVTTCCKNEEMTEVTHEMMSERENLGDYYEMGGYHIPENIVNQSRTQEERIIVERKRRSSYYGKRKVNQRVIQRSSPNEFRPYNYLPLTQVAAPTQQTPAINIPSNPSLPNSKSPVVVSRRNPPPPPPPPEIEISSPPTYIPSEPVIPVALPIQSADITLPPTFPLPSNSSDLSNVFSVQSPKIVPKVHPEVLTPSPLKIPAQFLRQSPPVLSAKFRPSLPPKLTKPTSPPRNQTQLVEPVHVEDEHLVSVSDIKKRFQ